MAKLTGAKKAAFLERMEKGRRKAARKSGNPKRKRKPAAKKAAKKKAPRKAAKRKPVRKPTHNPTVRRSKKVIGKGFSKAVASEWAKAKRKAKRKPTAKKKPAGRATKHRRRNSNLGEAEAMYETFHQKAPGHIVEYEQTVHYPSHYAELGDLIELRCYLDEANKDFPFTRFGDAKVVCTPDGANIYFIGGDQSIDFEALEISTDKDVMELGPCTYICYFTTKGFHDFQPTKYWHRFGAEDGVFPRLGYDRLNKTLFLIGGNYRVKREGIVN